MWVKLCPRDGVPEGSPRAFEIEPNKWIGVFRVQGTFYAINDECPHQGWPLSQGRVENKVVTCSGHGWSFDLETGKIVGVGDLKIITYPLKIMDENIWVDL